MKDWKTFTIGLLFGLSITLLIAATSTKEDDSENQHIGKYQMSIGQNKMIYIINTASGRIHLLHYDYGKQPRIRWFGFEGPEAEE